MASIGEIQAALATLRDKIEESQQAEAISRDETEETRDAVVELGAQLTAEGLSKALDLHEKVRAALATALDAVDETVALVQAVREGNL